MEKTALINSVTSTHADINEQKAIISGFLKEFNTPGILTELKGIMEFFNKIL